MSKIIVFFIILLNYSFYKSNKNQQKYITLNLISNNSYTTKGLNSSRLLGENDNDNLIKMLRNNISQGLIQNDTIFQYDDIAFEVSSTENQNNNKNSSLSRILIGECEKKIRYHFNIAENEKLIIFKYDYYVSGISAPIIEYEIFGRNNDKLDLKICKDTEIIIFVPSYDNSCFQSCEDNCQNLGYDSENKKCKCQCQVKTEMNLVSQIDIQKYKTRNFDNIYKLINNEDNSNDTNNKEKITEIIQNALKNGIINKLMENDLDSKGKGIIINVTNTFFQIFSTDMLLYGEDNNTNNEDNYLSRLDLGICLDKLKENYSIIDDPVIIFKVDHFLNGTKAPIIEYEIYEKNGNGPLDLNLCKDEKIKITIPVSLEENDLLRYNLSSDYYTDMCYSYKTEKGTDILLKDRKNECLNNNMFICDENCFFEEYDTNEQIALCSCQVKTNFSYVNNISSINLNDSFKESPSTNIFKCTKTFFSKDGIKYNIGSFIIIAIILLNIGLFNYFNLYGSYIIENEVNKVSNQNDNNSEPSINNSPPKKGKKHKKGKNIGNIDINPPNSNKNSDSKLGIKNMEGDIKKEKNNIFPLNNEKDKTQRYLDIFNDYELNNLDYNEAISYDSRTFFQYYCSLIKRKNLFLFGFISNNDYNPLIIKISIFSVSIALFYTINSMFIDDSVIHMIYESGFSSNYIYQLPFMILSDIISGIIITIIKFIFLSEKNILQLKKIKDKNELSINTSKIISCIKCKFILLFVTNFILLIFLWFYVGLFCTVFKNTQIFLIVITIISFILYLLYPFILCLLPALFRIQAISSSKKNSHCLYNCSKVIQRYI